MFSYLSVLRLFCLALLSLCLPSLFPSHQTCLMQPPAPNNEVAVATAPSQTLLSFFSQTPWGACVSMSQEVRKVPWKQMHTVMLISVFIVNDCKNMGTNTLATTKIKSMKICNLKTVAFPTVYLKTFKKFLQRSFEPHLLKTVRIINMYILQFSLIHFLTISTVLFLVL